METKEDTSKSNKDKYFTLLETFYSLKSHYENSYYNKKKKIYNTKELSISDKIKKIKKIKKYCIQCGNEGGTLFKDENRTLVATCKATEPCSLNIVLKKSDTIFLPDYIKEYYDVLYKLKKSIVITKLNYLFDLEKEDITSQKFKVTKDEYVKNDEIFKLLKKKLENHLNTIKITDQDGNVSSVYKKDVIIEKTKLLNKHLKDIEQIILLSKTSETKSKIRIWGAIKIYLNNVLPILEEIRKIKYEEMFVDSVHFSDVNGGSKEKFVLKSKKNNIQSFCYEYEEGRIMKKNFTNVTKPKKQKRKRKKKVVKASIQEFDADEVPDDSADEVPDDSADEVPDDSLPSTSEKKEEEKKRGKETDDSFVADDQPPPMMVYKDRALPEKSETPDGDSKTSTLSDLEELKEFEPTVDE